MGRMLAIEEVGTGTGGRGAILARAGEASPATPMDDRNPTFWRRVAQGPWVACPLGPLWADAGVQRRRQLRLLPDVALALRHPGQDALSGQQHRGHLPQ